MNKKELYKMPRFLHRKIRIYCVNGTYVPGDQLKEGFNTLNEAREAIDRRINRFQMGHFSWPYIMRTSSKWVSSNQYQLDYYPIYWGQGFAHPQLSWAYKQLADQLN